MEHGESATSVSLQAENQRLQENILKLSKHLEVLQKSNVDPKVFEYLLKEKKHLLSINQDLKKKIKSIRSCAPVLNKQELDKHKIERMQVMRSIEELDKILTNIKSKPEAFEVCESEESSVKELCTTLTQSLDEEQHRTDEAFETIRRLRNDDEKLILREKVTDLKRLVTDLEVENTRLRFENERSREESERFKKNFDQATAELTKLKKEVYALEEERDHYKDLMSNLENEKLKLKKDMIEELTEANRAKRVCADTEIALNHISEAYDNKRKEVMDLQMQLDEANGIIRSFRDQFEKNTGPMY